MTHFLLRKVLLHKICCLMQKTRFIVTDRYSEHALFIPFRYVIWQKMRNST